MIQIISTFFIMLLICVLYEIRIRNMIRFYSGSIYRAYVSGYETGFTDAVEGKGKLPHTNAGLISRYFGDNGY